MGGVVVITGGGRGIGAATATACAAAGFDVCLGYRADAGSAQSVVDACRAAGARAVPVAADVGVEADVARLFAVAEELGRVAALVNNAGIVAAKARVDELTTERIETMLRVNALGSFLC